MYLISLDIEDKIEYIQMSITISSFVANPSTFLKKSTITGQLTNTYTNTHKQGDYSNPTHGGEIKFHILGCIYTFWLFKVAFPTETGQYILDTEASNFGLGGVLSQIQDHVECVVAYCSRALRPSQRR